MEHRLNEIERILGDLRDYVNNTNFRDKNGRYGLRRIIKLSGSIDQTTGYTVSEETYLVLTISSTNLKNLFKFLKNPNFE